MFLAEVMELSNLTGVAIITIVVAGAFTDITADKVQAVPTTKQGVDLERKAVIIDLRAINNVLSLRSMGPQELGRHQDNTGGSGISR